MDRTDLDQLTAIADRRALAADAAAAELRRVGDDLMALGAGFVGLRRSADALTDMAAADRAFAVVFRRLALAARRPDDPAPEVPAAPRRPPGQDWRDWTEEDFPGPGEADSGPDGPAPADGTGPNGRPVPGPEAPDDWDDAPLVADIRLGAPPE